MFLCDQWYQNDTLSAMISIVRKKEKVTGDQFWAVWRLGEQSSDFDELIRLSEQLRCAATNSFNDFFRLIIANCSYSTHGWLIDLEVRNTIKIENKSVRHLDIEESDFSIFFILILLTSQTWLLKRLCHTLLILLILIHQISIFLTLYWTIFRKSPLMTI